ncbi:hypothetical protein [Geminocystis sp. GBBB08]|uniref:hypothetical protein n=1 Tax=Geminocystis sp. GBBB08 TaxID=2604140 RepID=UPI0027E25A14|nr:hypothetical protein [Geminocystis sp. GBBB08]MBL1208285.1 hypothetical protein [Geminocystis sp. GBBB08]
MTAFVKDGFAVRIPNIPSRYRANCSKDYGLFVHGDTKDKSSRDAEKQGLTKGEYVEMALVCLQNKTLTFEPNYINEPFTEVWGIPTAGEMKTQFSANASELSTFLLHRQSMDNLAKLVEQFSKNAFDEWVSEGMKDDYNEFAITKATEYYFTNIFRFEFEEVKGKYTYYYVKSSFRKAESKIEKSACLIAEEIYQKYQTGLGYCVDNRLELNHKQSIKMTAESSTELVK